MHGYLIQGNFLIIFNNEILDKTIRNHLGPFKDSKSCKYEGFWKNLELLWTGEGKGKRHFRSLGFHDVPRGLKNMERKAPKGNRGRCSLGKASSGRFFYFRRDLDILNTRILKIFNLKHQ